MRTRLALVVILFFITMLVFFLPYRFEGAVIEKSSRSLETFFYRYEIFRYPATTEITPPPEGDVPLGLATDTGLLAFGTLPVGGAESRRYINVTNTRSVPIKISFESYGSISPFLKLPESLIVDPLRSVSIPVSVTSGQDIGTFSGDVTVITIIPKNSLSEGMLAFV